MLQVLEFKGFITTADNGSGYVLTNKLFALAMAQAPVRSLVETALPIMRKLVQDIGQSAHIAVASEDQIVVITRIERPGDLGFSVRIGYRREIAAPPRDWCCLRTRMTRFVASGSNGAVSKAMPPIPSSSAPTSCGRGVSRGRVALRARHRRPFRAHHACDTAVAALTVPFVHSNPLQVEMPQAVEFVRAAARQISNDIVHGDLP
jgi:DNA-binding IclR family transcriptional regulator